MPPEETGDVDSGAEQDQQDQQGTGQQAGQQQTGPTQADVDRLRTALDKERGTARANAAAARELAALKASQQTDTEKAIAQARQEATRDAAGVYSARLAALSVKAAAAGKLRDPGDAAAHLSSRIGEFVGDDGEVDDKAIGKAVDQLLKDKPYLGLEAPPPSFDGGTRTRTTGTTDMNQIIRDAARRGQVL